MAGPHAGNRNRPAYSGQARFRFPKQIIQLFAPRPPLQFKPTPRKRKLPNMTGIAMYVHAFKDNAERGNKDGKEKDENTFETPAQRRQRVKSQKLDRVNAIVQDGRQEWKPKERDLVKTKDPFKTLFVANVAYTTLEIRLRHEFEQFGPVVMVNIPKDHGGVSKGYAFVEFEREADMKIAYREANGLKIDGRRLLVDVERGRTVDSWFPNRLDGPFNACVRKKAKLSNHTNHQQQTRSHQRR